MNKNEDVLKMNTVIKELINKGYSIITLQSGLTKLSNNIMNNRITFKIGEVLPESDFVTEEELAVRNQKVRWYRPLLNWMKFKLYVTPKHGTEKISNNSSIFRYLSHWFKIKLYKKQKPIKKRNFLPMKHFKNDDNSINWNFE